jgi:hypothetical protein
MQHDSPNFSVELVELVLAELRRRLAILDRTIADLEQYNRFERDWSRKGRRAKHPIRHIVFRRAGAPQKRRAASKEQPPYLGHMQGTSIVPLIIGSRNGKVQVDRNGSPACIGAGSAPRA